MKTLVIVLCLVSTIFFSCNLAYQVARPGKPWQNNIQQIPGRLECEYYDRGGEGVAYHDADSTNNGSGKLNPANGTFLNKFRMREGVDISYTKTGDIDDNHYNKVPRDMGKLYVGWTVPGEWINYTVKVTETATYTVGLMYTSNGDGVISLDIDGKEIATQLKITSTHDDRDTVKWRQWHHWNKTDSLANIKLNKGIYVLTIHIVANGNMNLDYLEFKKHL
ncbi:MAG: delta endotoxin C-terminal domain-containing protein [Mucilaginibacter sp.]